MSLLTTDVYKEHFAKIVEEMNMHFEKLPSIEMWDDIRCPRVLNEVDYEGKINLSCIFMPAQLIKYECLFWLILRHEIRECLAMQNYVSQKEAHRFAVRMERYDMKLLGVNPKEYYKFKKLFEKSDDNFFYNI